MLVEAKFDNVQILSATSANDAISLLMAKEVDLILSDIQMPDVDGFEFVDYIKQLDRTKNIPVIFLTGIYDKGEFQKKGYDLGVIDYISKPIENEILISKLKVFVDIFEHNKNKNYEIEELNLQREKQKEACSIVKQMSISLHNTIRLLQENVEHLEHLKNNESEAEELELIIKNEKELIKKLQKQIDEVLNVTQTNC